MGGGGGLDMANMGCVCVCACISMLVFVKLCLRSQGLAACRRAYARVHECLRTRESKRTRLAGRVREAGWWLSPRRSTVNTFYFFYFILQFLADMRSGGKLKLRRFAAKCVFVD